MSELLSLRSIRFAYRGQKQPALDGVDLDVGEGELVGLAGRTGAGKSTLVQCATGIVPRLFKGRFSGTVSLMREPIGDRRVGQLAGLAGTLFQDFESQLFATNARLEMAFGMENLGVPRDEMQRRLEHYAKLVGVSHLLNREPQSLSGGQKQRLALATVLCLEPRLLLCDEPTTDLDPQGRRQVTEVLEQVARSGRAVVLVDHDGKPMTRMNRLVILDQGRVVAQGTPADVLRDPAACLRHGVSPPPLFALFAELGLEERPATREEAQAVLERRGYRPSPRFSPSTPARPSGSPILEARDIWFGYRPDVAVLRGISLEIRAGECVAILGRNGSGKTTLVKQFNGLLRPTRGEMRFRQCRMSELSTAQMGSRVGFVFQNPDHMLFAATVLEEVAFGLRDLGGSPGRIRSKVEAALATVGLSGTESCDPFTMTKGQRQKLAVACVLACEPEVLVLDEPTTGLDAGEQAAMVQLLTDLNRAGRTIVIITHTIEAAIALAPRLVLMDQGTILADGPTRELFHRRELLDRAGLVVASPVIQLAGDLGIPALTATELAAALTRQAA